ncbi:MAG TPA: O-antigen ligase family protein [Solirubrobacteraceae bacterium]|jgi:O-antigen/teichoic acid export membrane protein/O-antigen ligase|nr:O-antigen ligase family protein [Solirubrobacteraceae bacterium]
MPSPLARLRHALRPSEENLLARSLTLNVGGRVVGLVTGFASSVLLARLLGPADRGLLALMLSVSTVALAVAAIGQPLAVTYYASRKDARSPAIVGNILIQALVLTVLVVPLTALLHGPISDLVGRGQGGMTWVLAAALVPVTFLDWTISNQLLGMLRFGFYNGLKFIAGIGYTLAVVLLLAVFHLGVTGGLIATALGSVITVAGCVRPVLGRRRPVLDRSLMKDMLRYGSRVQVGVIFQMVNYRLDVIVMQFFRPLKQVGFYVAAQTVAEFVITIATAFQSSLLPLVSHYEGDERQDVISASSLRHHGILAGAAVLANAVVGTAVIYFAYGPQFRPAVIPMLVLLPGVWFLGMGLVIQSDLGGRGRPGLSSKLAALAATVTVVLDLILIPRLGVLGGALASVCAYTTFGVASLIALQRVSGIPLRELVVPQRADFAMYWNFVVRTVRRRGQPTGDGESALGGHAALGGEPTVLGSVSGARTASVSNMSAPVSTAPARGPVRSRLGGRPPDLSAIRSHPDVVFYGAGLILVLAMLPLLRSPLLCVALVAVLIGGLIAWRSPAIPLALVGVPTLIDAVAGSNPLPSGGFTLLFSAWITVAVAFAFSRSGRTLPLPAMLFSVPVLASVALLGLMLIRLGISPDQAYGSVKTQLYAADVLIILAGALLVGTRPGLVHVFVLVLLATDSAGALVFVYDLATGAAHTAFNGRFTIAASEYPIDMGRASAEGLLLAVYTMISAERRSIRLAAMAITPVLAIALAGAGSRGPVVAFAFGLLTLLGLSATHRRFRRRLLAVGAVLLLAIVAVPLAVPSSTIARALSTIIGSASGLSSNGRSELWAIALGTFSHHLWLGIGTGGGATLVQGLLYPHNLLLEVSTELGLVGLVALLCVLGGFIRALGRCWRMTEGRLRLLTALLIAMFLTALVNAQFSDPIQGNGSVWLWGGIAVGMAARLESRRAASLAEPAR